jgi:NAD(P)-dependent dehydrogenase (short-subunit alcohol dehydrogenase family)
MPIADVSNKNLQQLISLESRVAVVTGAARGIGLAICRRLAEAGAVVVLADTDEGRARAAAVEITKDFGVSAKAVLADVREERSIVGLAEKTMASYGRLDIWVNNAGVFPGGPTLDLSAEDWDQVQSVNLRGAFLGAREAARRMTETPMNGGVILNIESVSGFRGRAGLLAYCASKHSMNGLTKSLAAEFGSKNVRVVGVAPTGISTPGVAERKVQSVGVELERIKALEKKIIDTLPLGRLGVADDVARVALFCVSDLAMLVTGSTVAVDAGAMVQ